MSQVLKGTLDIQVPLVLWVQLVLKGQEVSQVRGEQQVIRVLKAQWDLQG